MWNSLSKTTARGTSRPRHRCASFRVKPLGSRSAPAMSPVTIANPTTATSPDLDGDMAIVWVSGGTLTQGLFSVEKGGGPFGINFSDGGFDGVNTDSGVIVSFETWAR